MEPSRKREGKSGGEGARWLRNCRWQPLARLR